MIITCIFIEVKPKQTKRYFLPSYFKNMFNIYRINISLMKYSNTFYITSTRLRYIYYNFWYPIQCNIEYIDMVPVS